MQRQQRFWQVVLTGGKEGGDHQGDSQPERQGGDDNNRHVIGHLVHDPEVHGHKSVRMRLDLKN